MEDLISRQAALEEIKAFHAAALRWRYEQEEGSEIWWHRADSAIVSALEIGSRIKELPSADRQTGWIPVAERMPDKFGKCLVVFIPSGGTLWTQVLIARYNDLMGIAKPSFHIGNVGKIDFEDITERVTHWMPLPVANA